MPSPLTTAAQVATAETATVTPVANLLAAAEQLVNFTVPAEDLPTAGSGAQTLGRIGSLYTPFLAWATGLQAAIAALAVMLEDLLPSAPQTLDHLTLTISTSSVVETGTAPTVTLHAWQDSGGTIPYTDALSPVAAYSSSATGVATIGATSAVIVLQGPGSVVFTVAAGGKSATAGLTVTAPGAEAAVTDLAAVVNSDRSVTLTWIDDPGATNYTIKRNGTAVRTVAEGVQTSNIPTYAGPEYITLPSAQLDFLLGPQTFPEADVDNPAIVRLSANTRTDALSRGASDLGTGESARIGVAASAKAGTISHVAGSTTITGVGTSFLTDCPSGSTIFLAIPSAQDPAGEGYWYYLYVPTTTDDTHLTISSILAPYLPALTSVPYHAVDPSVLGDTNVVSVYTGDLMYYDHGFALYQAAYKHGDSSDAATLMAQADGVAKQWWEHPVNATARRVGNPYDSGNIWIGSRYAALGTLIAWALRGCPGSTFDATTTTTNVWAFCYNTALASWDHWLSGKGSADHVAYDTRDGGYALHWLVFLSQCHPDSTVRADCLSKALDAAINYFIRLQYSDGTWRATNDSWYDVATHTSGYYADQPFLVSLLIESLVDLHRAIKDDPTYTAQTATILAAIKLGVAGLQLCYAGAPHHAGYAATTGSGTAPVRAMTYALGDSNFGYNSDATTPAEAIPGDPNGLRWNDPALGIANAVSLGATLADAVAAVRFQNSTSVHAPYYAALYETDATARAAFIAWGDELMKAQWEYTDGDGFRSQYYTSYPKNKDWDEHMRAQMKALAWRRMALEIV